MKVIILACGRLKPEFAALAQMYLGRMRPAVEVREIISKRSNAAACQQEEHQLLLEVIPDNAYVMVLDSQGESLASEAIAKIMQQQQLEARSLVLIIGGADGVLPAMRARADKLLAFGKATWPHQLVRVMLLEQLYRAQQILAGHPYHK